MINSKYRVVCDYDKTFTERVVFITGVGRSGTTILSQLIGSMAPVYYFDEPILFNLMPLGPYLATVFYDDHAKKSVLKSLEKFKGNDGRWLWDIEGVPGPKNFSKQVYADTNMGAHDFISDVKPIFLVKLINTQFYIDKYMELFPGSTYIHIVRNGLNVIESAANLGWYHHNLSARMVAGPFSEMVHAKNDHNVPWYIPHEEVDIWAKSDMVTRLAHIWSVLVLKHEPSLAYEDLCKKPSKIAESMSKAFNIEMTDGTSRCIDDILKHRRQNYPPLSLNDIGKPVREKFSSAMDKMGY